MNSQETQVKSRQAGPLRPSATHSSTPQEVWQPSVAGGGWYGLLARVDVYALLLAALSLLALGPMLQAGYFWGAHDARHSVYFLFEFDRVFQDGIWYPRWFPDMTYGYGYPLFNIYGPLAFYVGEFFHLLGADFVVAIKLVFALAWVLSGLAMYGFVRRLFQSRPVAFVSGLAYVFMPYHLLDVYVRAAVEESVVLVFLPLTLWAFYESIVYPRPRAVLFVALAYAGLLFVHPAIALFFSVVLGAWIIFLILTHSHTHMRSFPVRTWIQLGLPSLAGLVLGLGLGGVLLLPLALEYKYVNVAQWTANYYNYADHFVYFFQLFSPTWGFGISYPGPHDGLSFQLGLVPFALALFASIAIVQNPRGVRPCLLFFVALMVLLALLMVSISAPVWKLLPLSSVAQFPWRLLSLVTFALSVLAGGVLLQDNAERSSALSLPALVLGALILLGSYPYIAVNQAETKELPVSLSGLMAFESSANEMTGSTVYAKEQPLWSPLADNYMIGKKVKSKVDYSVKPDSLYIGLTKEGLSTNGELIGYNTAEDNQAIVFNVQYYPGWNAYLVKPRSTQIIRPLPIEIDPPYGRIKVTLPKGDYFLLLRFEDTPPRTIGTILSGISLLVVVGVFAWDAWRRRTRLSSA